jgi:hypothetical protein
MMKPGKSLPYSAQPETPLIRVVWAIAGAAAPVFHIRCSTDAGRVPAVVAAGWRDAGRTIGCPREAVLQDRAKAIRM